MTVFSVSSLVSEMDKSSLQRIPLSCITDCRALSYGKSSSELNTVIDIEPAQASFPSITLEDIANTKQSKALVRKISLKGDRKLSENTSTEHTEKNTTQTQTDSDVECFGSLLHNTTTKPIILQMSSPTCKTTCKDAADGLWQRYKRATTINPNKILLFFATMSSMGTIILIYFTLRSQALAALYS